MLVNQMFEGIRTYHKLKHPVVNFLYQILLGQFLERPLLM